MSEYVTESEYQRRREIIADVKGALRGGTNVEKRSAQRKLKVQQWEAWWQRRLDVNQGADPASFITHALAELETRMEDRAAATDKVLKDIRDLLVSRFK